MSSDREIPADQVLASGSTMLGLPWAMAEDQLRPLLQIAERGGDPTAVSPLGAGQLGRHSASVELRDGVAIVRLAGALTPARFPPATRAPRGTSRRPSRLTKSTRSCSPSTPQAAP